MAMPTTGTITVSPGHTPTPRQSSSTEPVAHATPMDRDTRTRCEADGGRVGGEAAGVGGTLSSHAAAYTTAPSPAGRVSTMSARRSTYGSTV
jgi:hypothetical protein